jgi:hypothetical protein
MSSLRALALLFAECVIATCAVYDVGVGRDSIRAGLHLGYLSELFRILSAATTMVFLLQLGPGMHYAIEGASSLFDKVLRYVAYFLFFVIAALAIAYYGIAIDLQVNFTNRTGVINPYDQRAYRHVENANDLVAATSIILFIASLVITGLSIYTYLRRRLSPLKTVCLAGILDLVPTPKLC